MRLHPAPTGVAIFAVLTIAFGSQALLAAPVAIRGPAGQVLATVDCSGAESEFQMTERLRGRAFATLERRGGGVLLRTEGLEDEDVPAAGDVFIEDGGGCLVTPTPTPKRD